MEPEHHSPVEIEPQRPAVRFTRRVRHGCPVRSHSTYCSLYDTQTHYTAKYGTIRGMRVYYGSDGAGGWQPLDRPLRTITTLDRFGLVTWNGKTAMLRMLQVPELSRAMGFGGDFVLDAVRQRRDRIRILGNGVAPPEMQAIVETLTCPLY